jgi:hypothetical protein
MVAHPKRRKYSLILARPSPDGKQVGADLRVCRFRHRHRYRNRCRNRNRRTIAIATAVAIGAEEAGETPAIH